MTRPVAFRRTALASLVAALATAAVAAVAGPGLATGSRYPFDGHPTDETATSRTILVVGDSVTKQASGAIHALAEQRGDKVDVWALFGSAPCDFLSGYTRRLDSVHPTEVSIAFMGNTTSACMVKALGPAHARLTPREVDAVGARYYRDLATLVAVNEARHIRTWLVAPPAMGRGTFLAQLNHVLLVRLAQLQQRFRHAHLDTGGRDLLTPGGLFRFTERYGGVAHPLRYRDGEHLRLPYGTTLWALGILSTAAQAPAPAAPSPAPSPSVSPTASPTASPTDSPTPTVTDTADPGTTSGPDPGDPTQAPS